MTRPDASVFAKWRFLTLTLLVCAWLLVTPLFQGDWRVQLLLEAFLLATVLVTVWANPDWRRLRNVLVVLWLVSVVGSVLSVMLIQHPAWRWSQYLERMTQVPLLGLLAAGMLAFVVRERTLTVDSIFATVAAYLLVALMFAQIYVCMILWNPASFSLPGDGTPPPVYVLQSDMTYFSLVTLATVGYGDILPATATARMLAMFQAVTGQFYIAIVVAIFVGMYSSQRRD
jgi:hypothetical protein